MPFNQEHEISPESLEFIFHHVFLPPKVPQEDDGAEQHVRAMAQTFGDSISAFLQAEPRFAESMCPALGMIHRFLETIPGSHDAQADHIEALCHQVAHLEINGRSLALLPKLLPFQLI